MDQTMTAAGVPIIGSSPGWECHDIASSSNIETIANVTAWRVGQPVSHVRGDIVDDKDAIAKAHLLAEAYDRYQVLAFLLDELYVPQIDVMIAVVERVIPQVDARHGTFEQEMAGEERWEPVQVRVRKVVEHPGCGDAPARLVDIGDVLHELVNQDRGACEECLVVVRCDVFGILGTDDHAASCLESVVC
jgi:hypothetical protein